MTHELVVNQFCGHFESQQNLDLILKTSEESQQMLELGLPLSFSSNKLSNKRPKEKNKNKLKNKNDFKTNSKQIIDINIEEDLNQLFNNYWQQFVFNSWAQNILII